MRNVWLWVGAALVATQAWADVERPIKPAENLQRVSASSSFHQVDAVRSIGQCGASDGFRTGFENNESASGPISLWSNPATWGGVVPVGGQDVTIPAGKRVVLDVQTPVLGRVSVNGELIASHLLDVRLQAQLISVSGIGSKLTIGCTAERYPRQAQIVLHGANLSDAQIAQGMKGLLASGGARIDMFGEARLSWSQLAASTAAGATVLSLKEPAAGWRANDQLIVAPSGLDADEYDLVRIASVNGAQVSLQAPMQYPHWGVLQNYGGKSLDQRAAVGLLSRNIVIRGAGDADAEQLGAHVMIMDANAQIDGVEFRSAGQAGHPGRYPFHWHFAGERPNDFIRNSSIHNSFQRAIVVHQTNGVLVENNVAFNIKNHAFVWAEDGNEVRNRFLHNLGVFTTSPAEEDFAFPINSVILGNTSQAEFRSGTFWGRNFNVTLIGNIAAGSVNGMGFFFDRFSGGLGSDEGRGLVFSDNIAHSHYRPDAAGVAGEIYPEATFGHGLMVTTNVGVEEHQFRRYTGYKNYSGAWLEDRRTRLQDAILADNGAGAVLLRGVLDDAVIVGQSANLLGGEPPRIGGFGTGLSGAVHLPSSHGGARAPKILNVQVFNQRDAALSFDVDGVGYGTEIKNLRLQNTAQRFGYQEANPFEYGYDTLTIDDPEGALRDGQTPTRWFKRRDQLVTPECTAYLQPTNAYACPPQQSLTLRYEEAPSRWTVFTQENGTVIGVGQPWYFDQAMSQPNLVSLLANQSYDVLWEADASRRTKVLKLDDSAGKWLELSWPASSTNILAQHNNQAMTAASSLMQMRAASSSAYFYDAAAQRLRVKLVGGIGEQSYSITANYRNSLQGAMRAPIAINGLVPGVNVQRFNPILQSLRNRAPVSSPISAISSNATTITRLSALNYLAEGSATTVIQGYLNAPSSGVYKIGAGAAGGSVDLYIGERWVSGSRDNRFPVVGEPSTEYLEESNRFALQAGWHPITIVYVRDGDQTNFQRALNLRWIVPGSQSISDVPVFRTP
jgi:G8 domain